MRWRLVGEGTGAPGASGLPFEGSAALLARCEGQVPCTAELWRASDGRELRLLRRGASLLVLPDAGEEQGWRGRWATLNGVLDACLGDPLQRPPGRDPGARRELETEGAAARWAISLSGQNRCGLSGVLRLEARADRVNTAELRCTSPEGAELGWAQGGRLCARDALIRLLRSSAEQVWQELPPSSRAGLLQALSEDPGSAALVERLRAAD